MVAHFPFTGVYDNRIDPSKPAFSSYYTITKTTDRSNRSDMAL